jgi:hypothetical protein
MCDFELMNKIYVVHDYYKYVMLFLRSQVKYICSVNIIFELKIMKDLQKIKRKNSQKSEKKK